LLPCPVGAVPGVFQAGLTRVGKMEPREKGEGMLSGGHCVDKSIEMNLKEGK
jgi:hypothetical protein